MFEISVVVSELCTVRSELSASNSSPRTKTFDHNIHATNVGATTHLIISDCVEYWLRYYLENTAFASGNSV